MNILYISEEDEEAFGKWVAENSDAQTGVFSDRVTFTKDHWIAKRAWEAACQYKQSEINELETSLWQALGSLGYPTPHGHLGEKYPCKFCEDKGFEITKKNAREEALLEVIKIISSRVSA